MKRLNHWEWGRGLVVILFLSNCEAFNFRVQRQAGGGCQTARKESGSCINIKSCPFMLNLLQTSRNNRTTVDYLRGSMCGYEGNDPKVCCPTANRNEPMQVESRGEFSNLLSPPQCGKSAIIDLPRIVGGRPSELGTWPWITALGYRSRTDPNPQWLCGGALINSNFIVTAAHCNRHPRLTMFIARMGELNLDAKVKDDATPVDILIEKVMSHERYSPTKFTDDIALVKLREHVQFTPLIQPICLPKKPEMKAKNFVKFTPFIAGWGSTSFKGPASTALLEVQLPIIENSKCHDSYKTKGAEIINRQLCAGFSAGGKDACQGDSGGPMMLPQGEYFYLIGVVSYGYKCAEAGFPGVFTRVTEYVDWISENISK